LSRRSFTYGSDGWIRLRTPSQRSFLIHFATSILIILHHFFSSHTFKRFSFWSKPMGLEPKPSDPLWVNVLSTYTKLLIAATLSGVVRSPMERFVLVA